MLASFSLAACAAGAIPTSWAERERQGHLLYTNDTSFTSNWKALPSVGNGYVGTQITNPAEYVAGVFNFKAQKQSTRAMFPASTNIVMDGAAATAYALDMQLGTAMRLYDNGVLQRWYAHRVQKHLLLTEFETTGTAYTFTESPGQRPPHCSAATSDDPGTCYMEYVRAASSTPTMSVYTGTTDEEEYPGSGRISYAVVRTPIDRPAAVGSVLRFLSVRVTSLDSASYEADAIRMYKAAVRDEGLHATHTAAWTALASSGMFVEGDLDLAQSTNASFYAILSGLRADAAWSTSPGGLSTAGYWGNVFWDSDLWIYPNMVMFHRDLALAQMQYRADVQAGAAKNAQMQGWEGYQFPWQSAQTGQEVCYNTIYEYQEIHVSGDVAQALWQLYRSSHDARWLEDVAYPILYNISAFWASRVTRDADGGYSINNVMCPDEDANGVNNSAYTNAVAAQTLAWTEAAAAKLGKAVPAAWASVRKGLKIPFDAARQYHPEYDGYTSDVMVKQADVVLMGYPLMFPMPDSVAENDLNFYGTHTRNSVAMTWAIFTIGYQKIGKYEQAAAAFGKTVRHGNPSGPFHTWGEYEENSGCPNFITAAGGFLQSLWAGFGGVRLTDDALTITRPAPPSGGSTRFTLSQLHYAACRLTVDVAASEFHITVVSCDPQAAPLYAGAQQLAQGVAYRYQSDASVSITARPTPPSGCTDAAPGGAPWYLQAPSYTCTWFAEDATYCHRFGSGGYVGEGGLTAEEACCVCGGGVRGPQ